MDTIWEAEDHDDEDDDDDGDDGDDEQTTMMSNPSAK
jgi:hypothetical protein